MRLVIVLALVTGGLPWAFGAFAEGAPHPHRYPVETFFSVETLSGAAFSHDRRRILVTSTRDGIPNVYAVPVDGGDPDPITRSTTDTMAALSYFPSDGRILYARDGAGDELTQIYVRSEDGAVTNLTPGMRGKAVFCGWLRGGDEMLIATNERNPRWFDLYEVSAETYERTVLFRNDDGFALGGVGGMSFAMTSDKRYLALGKIQSQNDSDVYLVDRTTGRKRLMTPHRGDARHIPIGFSNDGKLYLLTDRDHEYLHVAALDVETYRRKDVVKTDADVQWAGLSRSGRYLAAGIFRDGRTELVLRDTETDQVVPVPAPAQEGVRAVSFSGNERWMALHAHGGPEPGDLYLWRIGSPEAPRRLTRRLPPEVDPGHLVDPEPVRFAAADGTEIPGFLYRPHQASPGNKVPAVVLAHGGPAEHADRAYDPMVQFLANRGYAIFAINYRGSTGYGKTFQRMDDGRHGADSLDDCVAATRMLAETGFVDPDRIAIMGASYGGFLTCAALAFRPEAFQAGINLFGVTDWTRTLRRLPPWWAANGEAIYAEIGHPDRDAEKLRAISPLYHADCIVRPMLVVQGANDARVSQAESDDLVAALRAHQVPVEYLVFPDEGHGIVKRSNQIRLAETVLAFLEEHLR